MNEMTRRIAAAAVGVLAALLMLAPSASATRGEGCAYLTAPAGLCQTDETPQFNGPSPFEYPVGFPGAL